MKYLCLDIGNVLVNQSIDPFVKAVSIQMNLSKEDSIHFVNRIQKKQDLGLTTVRDELSTHFSIKSEYILDNLIDAWHKVIEPNTEVLSFISNITQKYNIKTALLSNVGEEHLKYFNKCLGKYSLFNHSIHHFSCKVGARKPTSLYYKLFLDEHPEFQGSLYLDDLVENLETGSRLGFRTFHWDLSQHPWGWLPKNKSEELEELLKKG